MSLADELTTLVAEVDESFGIVRTAEGAFDNFMGNSAKMGAPVGRPRQPSSPPKRPAPSPGGTRPKKPAPPEGRLNPTGGFYERVRDLEQLVAEADGVPDKVKEYARGMEKGPQKYSPGKAYATAWSRFCAYHAPGDPHCHRKPAGYFRKA